ncbi:MAG: histidine--tRNA ligase [Candidatus Sungbacteria bacterium]|uniref:Histidine--tRNA ligase n=1 Tax=Candidatus Sungiibacteriota bacterium TaxID=2750080 RepID=A0A9D6QVQ4_9BACT|nr:histidine--tRNA ligase [Candidatus Sungbacteria bacterium]
MAQSAKKQKEFLALRGTKDFYGDDVRLWDRIMSMARAISQFYGFEHVEFPHIEDPALFLTGLGKRSDLAKKQLYILKTKDGETLSLRPDARISAARSYIQNDFAHLPQPVKLTYQGSMFRHDVIERGWFREFHQWGLEMLGEGSPVGDATIMQVLFVLLAEIGIRDIFIHINSLGCRECRGIIRAQLGNYYRPKVAKICRSCRVKLKDNPLKVLECRDEKCAILKEQAPNIIDHLCQPCKSHFKQVLEFLDESKIPYILNPYLVKGVDYYTRTLFEIFVAEDPNAQEPRKDSEVLAIGSGGRYDDLIETLGGVPTPAVGGTIGIQRVMQVIRERGIRVINTSKPKVILIQLGDLAKRKSLSLMEELRKAGILVYESLGKDSIKSQLHLSQKVSAEIGLIIGQKEAIDGTVMVREMDSGIQEIIPQDKLIDLLKKRLKK